jgi:hypothetical protein
MNKRKEEHAFSIELNSKDHIKQLTMSKDDKEEVLIEGFLGELGKLSFIEGAMLEIRGKYGILRMDLREEELRKSFQKDSCSKKKIMEIVK